MDTHNTGYISLDEWIAYLGERKKKRGLHWLNTFLHTLERGCGKLGLSSEQIADINRCLPMVSADPLAAWENLSPHSLTLTLLTPLEGSITS